MSGLIAAGVIGAGASLAAAKMSADGAKAGGEAAAAGAREGAITNANILRDQQNINRHDASAWIRAGQSGLTALGQLYGWGTLESDGGVDPYKWNASNAQMQQAGAQANLLKMANAIPTPTFTRLNVPTTFEADPGYQFRLTEGNKALDRSAASRGKLLSGEQVKAASDFNSGLASQEYGNWWNRYTGGTQFNNAASQQEYANTYGASRNIIDDWMRMSGMGQNAVAGTASVNSGLSSNMGNAFANAGIAGGQAQGAAAAAGGNAWASGIGSAFNNALTGAYLGGAFKGATSYGTPNTNLGSVGGMPMSYYR